MSTSTPDALSPSLILAHPTPDEQVQIWSENFPAWGRGLTLTDYLAREKSMLTHPLCTNDGFQSWILTINTASNDDPRPILSSCETYRKRAILRGRDGVVRDTYGYGIASVFTYERHRHRGYATRMMALLRDLLAIDAPCSVLYSDVGREFYARHGWVALHSAHLVFPVNGEDIPGDHVDDRCTRPLADADIPALAELDESLLRRELSRPGSAEIRVAFLPTADVLNWHFARDDFFCRFTLGRTPDVRGAIYTPTASNARGDAKVWALWTGVYNGGMQRLDKNVLYINRFVVQDDSISDEELSRAIRGILAIAREEAQEWRLGSIHWWNPSERVKRLSAEIPGLNGTLVVREDDSLCSLNWFGPESINDVEWVANQRFVWC